MLDNPTIFLGGAGEEAWDIDKGEQGDIKGITEADEARRLDGRVDIERAGQVTRLIGDDPHGAAVEAPKADDDVLGKERLDLQEVLLIEDICDDLLDIVR